MLIVLPSCSRYIKLAKKTFNQAQLVNTNVEQARCYIRSTKIYDQFTTIGIFDAILFNDKVEEIYNKLKSERTGQAFLSANNPETEFKNNPYRLIFYLLLPPDNIKDIIVTHFDGNVSWAIHLEINSKKILPSSSVKLSEIDPEFTYIFGPSANRFRDFYKLTFDVEEKIIDKDTLNNYKNLIKLCLRSTRYKVDLVW